MDFPHAGTLIHATLRPEDLIPAFWSKLQELSPQMASALPAAWPELTAPNLEREIADMDEAQTLVNELQDHLNECAPEGWYFGAIEGDGSDFGFWRTEEDEPS